MGDLILGLDQHLSGSAIVIVTSSIALLDFVLDQRNKHLQRASDLRCGAGCKCAFAHAASSLFLVTRSTIDSDACWMRSARRWILCVMIQDPQTAAGAPRSLSTSSALMA